MTRPDLLLNELERDALTELVNIGVSRAAVSLRQMVKQEILLSVPAIEIVTHQTAAALITEREGNDLIAVRQEFAGALQGRALLIFPQANSLELVRAIIGQLISAEDAAGMEEEALAETGNVILNSCLASMANILQRSLTMSLPQILRGPGLLLLTTNENVAKDTGLVLFFYINFAVRNHNIRGYIAMVMDLPSLTALKLLVNDFIERVMSDDLGIEAGAGP